MGKDIKILYVDDEKINLLLFERNFKDKYHVLVAEDGAKGLEILALNCDVDMIISDMKMPGMNGLEFICKVKERYPDKKCYILTGFEITEEISNALATGLIVEYFSKPYDVAKMHSIIAKVTQK